MVSWMRSLALRWEFLEPGFDEFEALALQGALINVRKRLEPEESLISIIEEGKEKPGVFLIARGESVIVGGVEKVKPNFRVVPLHHIRVVREEEDEVETALFSGLASVSPAAPMGEVEVAELVEGLISATKAKSKSVKDRYAPTLEGLMDGRHPVKGIVQPGPDEKTFKVSVLADWPMLMFVPVHLVRIVFQDSQNEAGGEDLVDEGDPEQLLVNLVQGMALLKSTDVAEYEIRVEMAENLVAFLWAIVNRFTEGAEVLNSDGTEGDVRHMIQCNQELLWKENQWLAEGKKKKEHEGVGGVGIGTDEEDSLGGSTPHRARSRIRWKSRAWPRGGSGSPWPKGGSRNDQGRRDGGRGVSPSHPTPPQGS